MDSDILMAMLGNISQEITNIKDEVSSIKNNTHDVYDLNNKLDRIIELLEKIAAK